MSKAIRWKVPFVSISGTHYRVDIYDEQDGSWVGITELQGGETPFVTDEDDSDDFFHPVRSQSGTLQVCTLKPDGDYITLDDLLPANNIARPVRLINRDNSDAIEWQGFLSCEAYSQDYTGIPQILDLPLISVLEAMDSVEVNPTTLSGMMYIFEIVYNTFHEIEQQSGMSLFDAIFYPKTDWRIFEKSIDATAFFKQNEYNNENSTTYIVSGLSCKDVLEKIATYMGWIVREHKTWLYFQRVGEDLGMYRQSALDFVAAFHSPGYYISRPLVTKELATDPAVVWMGTDHQRTVAAGAKSVKVVAKLEKYNLRLGLPEFPYTDISSYSVSMRMTDGTSYGDTITVNSIISTNTTFSNKHTFQQLKLNSGKTSGTTTSIANVVNNAIINPASSAYIPDREYVGAFMARIKKDDTAYQSGLYLSLIGIDFGDYIPTENNFIFSMRSVQQYAFSSGRIKIKIDGTSFYGGDTGRCWEDGGGGLVKNGVVKFGDKYWNGQSWQSSFTTVGYNPMFENDSYILPITGTMRGELFIYFYPNESGTIIPGYTEQGELLGTLISNIQIGYETNANDTLTDRSENQYFRLLDTNFRDEISINTDLASMLNNQQSPSLIMNTAIDPMKMLDYSSSAEDQTIVEARRPEVDLLNRLALYYSASRQRLELEMAHIESPALPLLKLNGINDGKVYLPLSESRDWQTDVCKLTCFEIPEQPSES